MKHEEPIPRPDEKLGHAMVKARLINENQLRTVLDYQRSLGGNLVDVVGKLGFARPGALQRFLAESNVQGSGGAAPAPTAAAAPAEGDAQPPLADTKLKKEASHPAPTAVAESEECGEEGDASPAEGASHQDPAPPSPRISDPVLDALITLLIKKGVFRRRELEDLLRGEGGGS